MLSQIFTQSSTGVATFYGSLRCSRTLSSLFESLNATFGINGLPQPVQIIPPQIPRITPIRLVATVQQECLLNFYEISLVVLEVLVVARTVGWRPVLK